MSKRRKAWTRRKVLIGVSAATLSAPLAANAQFGGSLNLGGTQIDLGNIFSGLKSIFEGLSLSQEDEIEMGEKLYPRLIAMSGGAYGNGRVQAAMDALFRALLADARPRELPWEITVVNDDTVNAWALLGGKLAVNKGLLRYVDSEDELAGVIVHEVGHAELSHAIGEMRTDKFTKGFSKLGAEAIMSQTRDSGASGLLTEQALEQLAGPMHEMVVSGYSRSSESEADRYMIKIFETSGHDPRKAVRFFETLLELIPADSELTTSLFSTHPGTRERIAGILAAAEEAPAPEERAPSQAYVAIKESFPTRRVYKRRA
jgi:predicted Zn-dependent protease